MKIGQVLRKYRWEASFILFLTLLEAGLTVLFPLFIGFAIDDAMTRKYAGAILLGALGVSVMVMGAGHRFFDSRFYAKLYQEFGAKVGNGRETPTSTKSAHLGFLGEVLEFFENALPEIVNSAIALVGTLIILAAMNVQVLIGCLVSLVFVILVYGLTQAKTVRFNNAYNEELESQVEVVSEHNPIKLDWHLRKLMKWNIKLSDLETINFSLVWMMMFAFLIVAIFFSTDANSSHGMIFSMVLYLFQFIEQLTIMPLFYQQWLRLTGMIKRLDTVPELGTA